MRTNTVGATYLLVGVILAAFVFISAMVARRPDRLTILVGVTLLAVAFFILPTRVHERYLYPFFALGAILAAVSRRWLVTYVVLSVATFLNMYVVVTTLYPGNPAVTDWLGIGGWIRSSMGVTINRPPRDGHMAFVRSPDLISIELLQKGDPLAPVEPWKSMQNSGSW